MTSSTVSQLKDLRRRGRKNRQNVTKSKVNERNHSKSSHNDDRGRKNSTKFESHLSSSKSLADAGKNQDIANNDRFKLLSYKPHNTLLVQLTEETPMWYNCGQNTPGRDDVVAQKNKNTREMVSKYRKLADDIYSHEVNLSRNNNNPSSEGRNSSTKDEKWVENTMKRGTLKDRIAAMSVVVGMDCIHKLYALDMLLDLAGCGVSNDKSKSKGGIGAVPNARVGQMASEALSDLFVNTLLPTNRKLIPLDERPLHLYDGSKNKTLSPRVLLLWRYEEMVKLRYASYLSRFLGRALAGEDEHSKKNALETSSYLLKGIPEGEEILLTLIVNKIGDPSRKIASSAGHQLRLVLADHPAMVNVVAREVQQLAHRPHLSPRALYNCVIFLNQLELFHDDTQNTQTKISASNESSSISLPASLINTYFHLFEMTLKKDKANKKNSCKKKSPSTSNKDSSGMKSRLLGALLTGVNRARPYLPEKDSAMDRHIDSLYLILHTAPPAASTQALMLLFHMAVGVRDESDARGENAEVDVTMRKDRFYRALYSKVSLGEMFAGRQSTMFFNLLYKAMKYDVSSERICAFLKRLLYTVLHQSSSIISGALFLLSEIVKHHPEIKHVSESPSSTILFDPAKREPRAAFAGSNSLSKNAWELSLLVHHFHPTVSKFTSDSDGEIVYNGDPLKDFALMPFLDKFAFRNPKALNKLSKRLNRGESIAERKSGLASGEKFLTALPLNDPSFIKEKNVALEEKFFHHFFVERSKRDEIKGIVRGSGNKVKNVGTDMEDEALNNAEAAVDIDFGDTDSEEEAFANQLAEKLMESSGNGRANFDDEDPDMDDWSDFGSDANDSVEENVKSFSKNDDEEFNGMDHEDAFMDAASSDDDEVKNSNVSYPDDSESDGFEDFGINESDNGDDGSSDEGDIIEERKSFKAQSTGGVKRKKRDSLYADADDIKKLKKNVLKKR